MARPRLPPSILIGKTKWAIRAVREIKRRGRKTAVALCEFKSSTIYLCTRGASHAEQADRLLHEIEHAIWHEAEIEPGHSEETVVCRTTPVRAQVIRDNPDVFGWVFEKLHL